MKTQLISPNNQDLLHLLDSISDALVFTNMAGEIVHVNEAARQVDPLDKLLQQSSSVRLDTLPLESIPLEPELDNLRVFRLVEPPQGSESLAACFSEAALPRPDMMLRVFNALGLCLILLDEHNAIQDMNKQARAILSHAKLGDDIVTLLPEIQETLSTLRKDALESFSLTAGGYDFEGCALRWQGVAGWQTLLICLEPPAAYTDEFTRVGLLRMLIHDLSNPLYIALNFGRLLQDNIIAGEEATQATDIIVNNLQRMQDLLADLSSLEQLGENISSSFESVEIATIAATVVANLDERAHSQQIRLLLNPLPDDGCHIHGNERLLRQALHNLVENAIKYTLPGGWVRVTVRPTGQHYEILVADNGIGIAPAKHRQLFTPFFRVKDPRMPEVNGTGLGLSLVRMVAAQHRGQVRLHSIPEKGTIFVMQLPRSGARQQQLQQYLQR